MRSNPCIIGVKIPFDPNIIICMSEILLNIEYRKDLGVHEGEAKGQEHMEYMDGAYKKINYILVSLINEIWELEGKAIITEEFADLTNNDMHVTFSGSAPSIFSLHSITRMPLSM